MIVWSFGGGVQSVAIAALVKLGRLPMPDLIVIADTGREVDSTWATCERLREAGFAIHVASHELSSVDLYALNGDLLIPAFTGERGMLRTLCSNEWKQRVVRRWLRARGVKSCDAWLGISVDEAHRMKPSGLRWLRHVYPLIELGVHRRECPKLIEQAGLSMPAKSRCWCCPYQNAEEWRSLSAADRDRAIRLDAEIRTRDATVFLHRSRRPLADVIDEPDKQAGLFDGCDSGQCWT